MTENKKTKPTIQHGLVYDYDPWATTSNDSKISKKQLGRFPKVFGLGVGCFFVACALARYYVHTITLKEVKEESRAKYIEDMKLWNELEEKDKEYMKIHNKHRNKIDGVISAVLTVKYYVTYRLYLSTLKPKKETKGDEKGSHIKDNDSG